MPSHPEKCPDCKGKGRWKVRETYSDGETAIVWYECGTCSGSGMIDPEEDSDPRGTFDIGEMVDEDD